VGPPVARGHRLKGRSLVVSSQPASDHALHQVQPIDGKALRRVCGHFVTGVTVITCGVDGHSSGTTVNSFTSVSLEPPLVLFCLHKDSRLREVLHAARSFAVNFLAGRQEALAWAFAGKQTAVFDDVAHHHSADGVPILSEALAYLACKLTDEFEGGDHHIYLGEVVELGIPQHHQDPLIFFRGTMGALEDEPGVAHPFWDG
jgi:3-hydroxy-9,10-secoandrosta-1,3,5(10)-triene-9,17-dione monooxygenase reductase component